MRPDASDTIRYGSLIRPLFIGGTVMAVLSSAQHWAVMQLDPMNPGWQTVSHALTKEAPIWYLWVLASPIVYWSIRRIPFRRGNLIGPVAAHTVLAVLLVLAHEAVLLAIYRITGFPTRSGPFWDAYRNGVPFRLMLGLLGYAVLFGAVLAFDYSTRLREEQVSAAAIGRQLAEARLQALRMQLNPHFLFNAMNTIAMLVRKKSDGEAVKMLAGLSEILRQVLVESPPQETRLKDEIAFTERYLSIERARFGDRLSISVTVEPAIAEAWVPTLVLQPLVENAVHHGVGRRAAAGTISIVARRLGADVELLVTDNGPGPKTIDDTITPASGVSLTSGGIGLRNTRERLAQLYGERGTLELLQAPAGGATARVRLPFRLGQNTLELDAVVARG